MKILKKRYVFIVFLVLFCFVLLFFLSKKFFIKQRSFGFDNTVKCKILTSGKVIRGKQIARTTGYPTANIPYINNSMKSSVFVSLTKVNNVIYKSATFYNKDLNILESHILDFDGVIYNKKIEVCLLKKIRDKMKFNSKEEAEAQFAKDVKYTNSYFSKLK